MSEEMKIVIQLSEMMQQAFDANKEALRKDIDDLHEDVVLLQRRLNSVEFNQNLHSMELHNMEEWNLEKRVDRLEQAALRSSGFRFPYTSLLQDRNGDPIDR